MINVNNTTNEPKVLPPPLENSTMQFPNGIFFPQTVSDGLLSISLM